MSGEGGLIEHLHYDLSIKLIAQPWNAACEILISISYFLSCTWTSVCGYHAPMISDTNNIRSALQSNFALGILQSLFCNMAGAKHNRQLLF